MPRQDWFRDDTMSRDRDERGYFGGYRSDEFDDQRGRDSGAFFDRDQQSRGSERNRPMGGWGGLMGDDERDWSRERSRGRDTYQRYGSDDDSDDIPTDETERLIASNKVEGTPVYGRRRERLGSIYNFMVDKYKGEVVYAVLRHGGFLGLGDRYYPLDWDDLTYDTRLGGYRVSFSEDDLDRFESFDSQGRSLGRGSGHGGRGGQRGESRSEGRRDRGNRYTPW
ncbi:MAG TPA: PRC-barrel domain-containing protein [Sphingomicrobium sp.]|nr:PRC-barrel domain-containing protein [Sphingomicrobium sp.]